MNDIAVSVVCNTYNHEKYIRDALESFVMQKTAFKYEVLVHDDASTDRTADIIREYEEKYPDIIKPIYQTENQYSKDSGAVGKIQLARVNGRYIALCEGDEYWTDPLKLQKQYDAMEQHPELDICTHGAYRVNAETGKVLSIIAPEKDSTVISTERVISGGGGFVATNSIMYRASIAQNIPEFRRNCNFDYMLQINGALRGGMLYLEDIMSSYRVNADNSWTQRMCGNIHARVKHCKLIENSLNSLNVETNGTYDSVIRDHIRGIEFEIKLLNGEYRGLKREYKKYYDRLNFKHRAYITVAQYIPAVKRLRRMLINGGKRKI